MIAGAMLFIPITLRGTGTRARVVSSAYTSCSSTVAPRPPYSCGHETAAQPASAIVAFQARSVSNVSSSLPRRRPAATTSWVRFAANHARNSLRTGSTSGGYEKSTFACLPRVIDYGQAGLYVGTDIWSTEFGRSEVWSVASYAAADRLQAWGMLASALAGRIVAVAELQADASSWTDGQTIYIDAGARTRAKLEAIAVHASMLAAGSLEPEVVTHLVRHPRLARRYLAVEGHRALVANRELLPVVLASLGDPDIGRRSESPAASLQIARDRTGINDPAPAFGVIRAGKLLAVSSRAVKQEDQSSPRHAARRQGATQLEELDDGKIDDSDDPDMFTSPVGGGGLIGKWLKRMLSSARKTGSGGGPP